MALCVLSWLGLVGGSPSSPHRGTSPIEDMYLDTIIWRRDRKRRSRYQAKIGGNDYAAERSTYGKGWDCSVAEDGGWTLVGSVISTLARAKAACLRYAQRDVVSVAG